MSDYANYSPRDFNRYDCLTLSLKFYIILAFFLRAYIIWLASIANLSDKTAILQAIYAAPMKFYADLSSGFIAVFILLVVSLRRPDASTWVKNCWSKLPWLIGASALMNLVSLIVTSLVFHGTSLFWAIIEIVVITALLYSLYTSRRFRLNLAEFPQPMPEK